MKRLPFALLAVLVALVSCAPSAGIYTADGVVPEDVPPPPYEVSVESDDFTGSRTAVMFDSGLVRFENGARAQIGAISNVDAAETRTHALTFTYRDDDWLFITDVLFRVDGETISPIETGQSRDVLSGGNIRELVVASVDADTFRQIAFGDEVNIRLAGNYRQDFRLPEPIQNNLKRYYNDYIAQPF